MKVIEVSKRRLERENTGSRFDVQLTLRDSILAHYKQQVSQKFGIGVVALGLQGLINIF